ncbi:hypothetical protein CDAR_283561 [Caerostris darwini]|uniref:Uncharacterized protein n=1 Tax=Caerostris darwini TaxID=1538125 RepID=A0AAV4PC63_9ARAC|nr:hypothetical protein CDAR_283561 [Caerostris darwini]
MERFSRHPAPHVWAVSRDRRRTRGTLRTHYSPILTHPPHPRSEKSRTPNIVCSAVVGSEGIVQMESITRAGISHVGGDRSGEKQKEKKKHLTNYACCDDIGSEITQ